MSSLDAAVREQQREVGIRSKTDHLKIAQMLKDGYACANITECECCPFHEGDGACELGELAIDGDKAQRIIQAKIDELSKPKGRENQMEKQLAKISKAKLEIQERGMLNFWICVDYEEGYSQNIGGICLDEYNREKEKRVGTAYGCEMIRRLLLELQVDDFSEMKGKHIWVHGEGSELSFNPKGISALKSDNPTTNPVIFKDIAKEFIN